jgi:hypothetical protein
LLRGSHGHLLASVWSTLAEFEGRFFAHDNPISFTG